MPDAFRISTIVSALPERVYSAWLDSGAHAAFTGGEAKIDPSIGGKFTAWDGYIQGRTVEVLQGRRIVQTWRTKEFPSGSPDSRLEVQFEFAEGGTRVTILHSNIPDGQGERYKTGWNDHYFQPMREYFAKLLAGASAPRDNAAVPKPKKSQPAATKTASSNPKRTASNKKASPAKAPKPSARRAKTAARRPARKAKKRRR